MKRIFKIVIWLWLFFWLFGFSNAINFMHTNLDLWTWDQSSFNIFMWPYIREIWINKMTLNFKYVDPRDSDVYLLNSFSLDYSDFPEIKYLLSWSYPLQEPYSYFSNPISTNLWHCPDPLPVFSYTYGASYYSGPKMFYWNFWSWSYWNLITEHIWWSLIPTYTYNIGWEWHNIFYRTFYWDKLYNDHWQLYFNYPEFWIFWSVRQVYEYWMMKIEKYWSEPNRFYAPWWLSSHWNLFLWYWFGFSMVWWAVNLWNEEVVDWDHTLFRSIWSVISENPDWTFHIDFNEYNWILIIAPNLELQNYWVWQDRTLVLSKDPRNYNRLVYNLYDCRHSDYKYLNDNCSIIDMWFVKMPDWKDFFHVFNNKPDWAYNIERYYWTRTFYKFPYWGAGIWTVVECWSNRWFNSPYYNDNYTTNKDASWIWVLYNWSMDWQSPLVLVNLAWDVLRFTHILYNWDLTHVDFKLVSNFQTSFDIYLPYLEWSLNNNLNFISPSWSWWQYIPWSNVIWTWWEWTIVDSWYNIDSWEAFVPTTWQWFFAFSCPYDTSWYPSLNLWNLPIIRNLFPTLDFDIIRPITCIYAWFKDWQHQQAERLSWYTNSNMFWSWRLFEKTWAWMYTWNWDTSSNRDLLFRFINLIIMWFAILIFYKLIK